MGTHDEPTRDSAGAPGKPTGQEKKPYRSPRLVVYGDLRRIAMGGGGVAGDGKGKPATKL